MPAPLPKPEKREPKPPRPLERKTPLRSYRLDKNGLPILAPPKAPKQKPNAVLQQIKDAGQVVSPAVENTHKRKNINRKFPKGKDPDAKTLDAMRWQATRICWFAENPPDYDGDYYQCRLCPYAVHASETTLDHIKPRGTYPELKFTLSNLQPSHAVCNVRKGSMSMEAYLKTYPLDKLVIQPMLAQT